MRSAATQSGTGSHRAVKLDLHDLPHNAVTNEGMIVSIEEVQSLNRITSSPNSDRNVAGHMEIIRLDFFYGHPK